MKTLCTLAVIVSFPFFLRAEMQVPIPLWPDGAPGALGSTTNDIPTLTPYLPDSIPPVVPPGGMESGKYGVSVGMSLVVLPSAPGAPSGQSGIGTCISARRKNGKETITASVHKVFMVCGHGAYAC